MTPANIDDSVPTEEEVEWVVWRLRGTGQEAPPGCVQRISGSGCGNIRNDRGRERQKQRLQTQTQRDGRDIPRMGGEDGEEEREREKTMWERVVELVQTAFQDGVLMEEATWQALV